MPHRTYRHNCPADGGREKRTAGRRCRECGQEAEFDSWRFGVVEQWCRYNGRTGLSPFGPKPPWLKEKQITRTCRKCNGHGLLGMHLYHGGKVCPECRGAGGFPVLDAPARAAIYQFKRPLPEYDALSGVVVPGSPADNGTGQPPLNSRRPQRSESMTDHSEILHALLIFAKPGFLVRHENGFTWWQDGLRQQVRLQTLTSTDGVSRTRIQLRTDLTTGFVGSEHQLKTLDLLTRYAGLSRIVPANSDPEGLQLTAAFCYETARPLQGQNMAWLPAYQMAEAHGLVPLLEETARFSKTETPPPEDAEHQDGNWVWDTSSLLLRGEESYWKGSLEGILGLIKDRGPCLLGTADEDQLAAEFPFPGKPGSSLLRMSTTEVHPRLGNGLLVRLTLPIDEPDQPSVQEILALNQAEESGFTTVLGSWCRSEEGLVHVTFLHNLMVRMGSTDHRAFVDSILHRVQWISRHLFDYDVYERYYEAVEQRAALTEKFMQVLRESQQGTDAFNDPDGGSPGAPSQRQARRQSPYIKKTFHERLADQAIRDGNTPSQFRAAARSHANAFWIWMTLGGIIWFFFGWWALIPVVLGLFAATQGISSTLVARELEAQEPPADSDDRERMANGRMDVETSMDLEEVSRIRSAYADLLENDTSPYAECMYKPATLLPYPKAVIADALEHLLEAAEGGDDSAVSFENPEEAVRSLRMGLDYLDDFLEVPADELPTDPVANVRFGSSWQSKPEEP